MQFQNQIWIVVVSIQFFSNVENESISWHQKIVKTMIIKNENKSKIEKLSPKLQ